MPCATGRWLLLLNNIAITALQAVATGATRVAVFDFDVHHGNGTEADAPRPAGVRFFSVHQFPCYPGSGTRNVGSNCFKLPGPAASVTRGIPDVLSSALNHLRTYKPGLVAVSAGFDSYVRDPLARVAGGGGFPLARPITPQLGGALFSC